MKLPKASRHVSVSAHKMAYKFQKMLSKDNNDVSSELEGHLHKKITQMLKDKQLQDNVIWGNNEPIESHKHQDYLEAITVSINLQEDLSLYKYHTAFSNEFMSVVGIEIVNPDLIQLNDETPEFIDVFGTSIAYTGQDPRSFYAIDVGGYHKSLEKVLGKQELYKNIIPLSSFRQFVHTFHENWNENNKLICFKLGHHQLREPNFKAVIIATSSCSVYPFTFEIADQKRWRPELIKNRYTMSKDNLFFDNKTNLLHLYKQDHSDFIEDESEEKEDQLFTLGDENDTFDDYQYHTLDDFTVYITFLSLFLVQWLDFDVLQETVSSYDENLYELALIQDKQSKNLVILQGQRYGLDFIFKGSIRLKSKVDNETNQKFHFTIEDAMLLSVYKILALVEVSSEQTEQVVPKTINLNENEEGPPLPNNDVQFEANQQVNQNQSVQKVYRLFVFELDPDDIKQQITKSQHEFVILDKNLESFKKNWKTEIIVDKINQNVYIPDYGIELDNPMETPSSFHCIHFDNQVQDQYDSIQLTTQILCDIVGNHHTVLANEKLDHFKGLLYSDFILSSNLLFVSHGRFVTVIDINLAQKACTDQQQYQQFAYLKHCESKRKGIEEGKRNGFFDFSNEIDSLLFLDKDEPGNVNYKQKVLAILKSGAVLELEKQVNTSRNNNALEKEYLKNYGFRDFISPALYEDDPVIPGKIIKHYFNQNSKVSLPYMKTQVKLHQEGQIHGGQGQGQGHAIQNELVSFSLIGQNIRRYEMKQLIDGQKTVIMLNQHEINFQEVLIVESRFTNDSDKGGQTKQLLKQTATKYKLNIQQYGKKHENQIFIEEKDLPSELSDIQTCESIFVSDLNIYFIHADRLERWNLKTDDIQTGQINRETLSEMQIFDDQYFYWRQHEKRKNHPAIKSQILFDLIQKPKDLKWKSQYKQIRLFMGLYTSLNKIYLDRTTQQLAAFTDFATIKIWPLLHTNEIILRNGCKKKADNQILATKLVDNRILVFYQNGMLHEFDIRTAKLILARKVPNVDLQNFFCKQFLSLMSKVHQLISHNRIMVKMPMMEYQRSHSKLIKIQKIMKQVSKCSYLYSCNIDEMLNFINDAVNGNTILAQYKIIEFCKTPKPQQDNQSPLAHHQSSSISSQSQLSLVVDEQLPLPPSSYDYQVKELYSFYGPCYGEDKNYGLYAGNGKDLSMFIYYFKDTNRNLKVVYLAPEIETKNTKGIIHLKLLGVAKLNIPPSIHSPNFLLYLDNDEFNNITIKPHIPYKNSFDKKRRFLSHSQWSNVFNAQNQLQKASENLLEAKYTQMNLKIGDYLNNSNPYTYFLSNNKLLFINKQNMVLSYDIARESEDFNVTQCALPISDEYISIDSFMKIKGDKKERKRNKQYYNEHVIGENTLILERGFKKWAGKKKLRFERVCPNNFNKFFKVIDKTAPNDTPDEHSELRYIQNHYKNIIELKNRCYYGYIFQSTEFFKEAWQTNVHVVQTFNFYQMRSMKLVKDRLLSLDELPLQQLKELCFAQMPDGETLMHAISESKSSVDKLLGILPIDRDSPQDSYPFYIPILENKAGHNVLTNLFASIEDKREEIIDKVSGYFKKSKVSIIPNQSKGSKKSQGQVDLGFKILNYMGDYPFDLYKVKLLHMIKDLINEDVERFATFLEKRTKIPQFLEPITVGKIKNNQVYIFTSDQLWQVDDATLQNHVRAESDCIGTIDLKVLDVPLIHVFDKKSGQKKDIVGVLYERLQELDSSDVFELGVIKALIEVKFKYIRNRILLLQLLPFIVFMSILLTYTVRDWNSNITILNNQEQTDSARRVRIALLSFVGYFLFMELIQMPLNPRKYFSNFWNYMDLTGFVLIILAEAFHHYDNETSTFETNEDYIQTLVMDYRIRICYATSALILWNRFLYFFRVFRSMGYYIRMLTEVIKDILHFIFIFSCVVIAFGHAFLLFSRNNSTGPLITGLYMAILDSYMDSNINAQIFPDYQNWLCWIFFLLSSVATNIVLMNLLISIIGNTFDRIKDKYRIIMYKDMVHLIQENRYLYRGVFKDKKHQGKYMYMTIPKDDPDPLMERLEELKVQMNQQLKLSTSTEHKLGALNRMEEKEKITNEKIEKIDERQRNFDGAFDNSLQAKEHILEDRLKKIMEDKLRQFNAAIRKKQRVLEEKQDLILKKLDEKL